jgi:predicted HTH transcriptional regulator
MAAVFRQEILAKEISAFANSAGGVIVFGVDCRIIDGIDEAVELTPISNLNRAETTVRDATSDLLQPRHDGIRVASVPALNDSTTGYVIVDVPRSDRRPHRSEAANQKEYYKRIGSRSYPMEHYDIEDAFKRSTAPILALDVGLIRPGSADDC